MSSGAREIAAPADLDEFEEYAVREAWSDGFPIVPPTPERVAAMVGASGRPADELLGKMPPFYSDVSVEKVAINAVMAGCRPSYFPGVLAAVESLLDPEFNLYSIQATTNPVAPLLIFSGPWAEEVGLHSGAGALGAGFHANATIGRALRLCMLNLGGGRPIVADKATLGFPGKFSFCLAENAADSPWPSLREREGYRAEETTVTAFGATGTTNVLDYGAQTGRALLDNLAESAAIPGSNNLQLGGGPLFLISPEHAQIMARDGFSIEDVRRYLFLHARVARSRITQELWEAVLVKRRPLSHLGLDSIPVANAEEDILVVVTGGPGPHTQILPSFGEGTKPVTRAVRKP